jgi:hypothetical protein
MSLPRWAALGAAGVLLVGACAPSRPIAPTQVSHGDLVVVATAGGLTALDTADGRLIYQASNAVATPDWSRLVFSLNDATSGALGVLDGRTGASGTPVRVDTAGGLTPMVISNDGQRVVLGPAATPTDTWQPAGRQQTRIVVADPSGTLAPRGYDLAGNYEPDAFANDNRHLFLLEYQPPQAPDRYVVRQLDLSTGAVSGVGSRSKEAVPEENMRGTRRMHVLSPDQRTLYTLYTHQPDHLHSRDLAAGLTASSGTVHAFVHVLSLSEGWAYCLDLPRPFGIGPAADHSLALSPDGNALYVADRSSGMVARVDTNQLVVRTTANAGADPTTTGGLAAAQVGSDGSLLLSGGSEILVLNPMTLEVVRHLAVPGITGGLGVSTDGQRLFVTIADTLVAVDLQTGAELNRFAVPSTERIEYVGPTPTPP